MSSINQKKCFFNTMYHQAEENRLKIFKSHYSESSVLKPENLEQARIYLSEATFRTEYEQEFLKIS
jgi:hypothetical protein